ncbi:S-layer homology domain-containing protein [Paenibacillus sp. JX-17]|uniref:S-layer homology domain-containing protein n=1 Tax=Paenibacillus lacisoli TaxID=3064525 RepID=A0ABT9C903_9BACL|nr:S-layer homology domain-containing protein [Paenibacillus sp. JX-17]MDO7905736.1 S-layer homology domain-containing protein [Paenibacillus sp. JX-17]
MRKWTNKQGAALAVVLAGSLVAAASASAFSDVTRDHDAKVIDSLQTAGIIQGVTKDKFAPNQALTQAQGIQLIVKALGLKLPDNKTSLSKQDAWYDEAYEIAEANGLPVKGTDQAGSGLTRVQFANLLYHGINATGSYPTVKMYINIADQAQIPSDAGAGIQFLLLTKITSLDQEQKFNPNRQITRMEAAEMAFNAREFIRQQHQADAPAEQPGIELSTEKVTDQVNKITITRKQAPNPGYGIAVDRIEFTGDKQAVLYYRLLKPAPGEINMQVITDTQTSVYLDSKYEVSLKPVDGTPPVTDKSSAK